MTGDMDNFLLGAGFNLLSAIIIVRFIYYPWTQNRSYVFTFISFDVAIYFVMSMLTSIELGLGVGFGLFAIFSVIRYRTEEMPIREMTYLFIIIALPVMNSLLASGTEVEKILIANGVLMVLLAVLEREWGFHFDLQKRLHYDRIDLIVANRYPELLADLRHRTGLEIKRAEVGRIDFVRDTAEVTIYYTAANGRHTGLASEHNPIGRALEGVARD